MKTNQFSRSSIKFLGHVIDGTRIHLDPDKIQAIMEMKSPATVTKEKNSGNCRTTLS